MKRPFLFFSGLVTAILVLLTSAGVLSPPDFPTDTDLYISARIKNITASGIILDSCYYIPHAADAPEAVSLHGCFLLRKSDAADYENLLPGLRITASVLLSEFDSSTNPGETDYKAYYRSQGIYGSVKLKKLYDVNGSPNRLLVLLSTFRQTVKQRLQERFSKDHAALLADLMLGDRSEVEEEQLTIYRRGGIAHILSISGLHISILGIGLFRLLRRLPIPPKLPAIICSLLLILYWLMTGMSISASRALILFLFRMAAYLLGRTPDPATNLGAAAMFIALSCPFKLYGTGFLLSFGAVSGILILQPSLMTIIGKPKPPAIAPVRGFWQTRVRKFLISLPASLQSALIGSVTLNLSTAPLSLLFFYEFPLYSVPINLLILPLVSPLLIGAIICVSLPLYVRLPQLLVSGILDYFEKVCLFFEKLPHAVLTPGAPGRVRLLLYAVCIAGLPILAFLLQRNDRKKAPSQKPGLLLRFAKPSAAVIILLLYCLLLVPRKCYDSINFLDVGQGDCIIVTTSERHVYIIDCGSSSRTKITEKVILPYLKYNGLTTIEGILLTHSDTDHINGITALLTESNLLRIRGIYTTPQALNDESFPEGISASALSAGSAWSDGALSFEVLHPSADFTTADDNKNAASLCLLLTVRKSRARSKNNTLYRILLTGDIEKEGETALLERLTSYMSSYQISEECDSLSNPRIDILKAAHHGSKYSGSREFLEQICPRLTVISCGRNNRYGHPHEETLSRLSAVGSEIVRTDTDGAIQIRF